MLDDTFETFHWELSVSGNKTGNGERERRQAPEWLGVKICSHEMMGWFFSISPGMKTSLGEWLTEGKLTPVIVSPVYEPLDSLSVSNFYYIFTIRTRTEYCQDTSVCNFQKSESSLHHYGLELPIIVHIVESFTFLCPHSATPSAQIETFKKLGTFPGSWDWMDGLGF